MGVEGGPGSVQWGVLGGRVDRHRRRTPHPHSTGQAQRIAVDLVLIETPTAGARGAPRDAGVQKPAQVRTFPAVSANGSNRPWRSPGLGHRRPGNSKRRFERTYMACLGRTGRKSPAGPLSPHDEGALPASSRRGSPHFQHSTRQAEVCHRSYDKVGCFERRSANDRHGAARRRPTCPSPARFRSCHLPSRAGSLSLLMGVFEARSLDQAVA